MVAQTSFFWGGGIQLINCWTVVDGYCLFLVAARCVLHIPLERPETI